MSDQSQSLLDEFERLSDEGGTFAEWNALMLEFHIIENYEYADKCYQVAVRLMEGV